MAKTSRTRFGDFTADSASGELRKHGYRVRLQEKPFQVLLAILERPGELVTREELHKRLWGEETFVDFDNNLNTAVYKLREALNDTAETPQFIETLPRKGYRFIGAIEDRAAPATQQAEGRAIPLPMAVAAVLLIGVVGLAVHLQRTGNSSTALASSDHPAARESFLKGKYLFEKGGAENARRAAAYFQEAVAADPQFAQAYAALANALSASPRRGKEEVTRAKEAASRAIHLNPRLAEAHHRLASIHLYEDWDWPAAEASFEEAARLAPDSAPIHHSYAGYFSLLGQHERAQAEMQRAMELNPVSVAVSADAGWYWFVARRYDEAITQSKKALELDPQHRGAHYYILLALLAQGDTVSARAWALKYLPLLDGTKEELQRVAAGDAAAGLRAFWEVRLARALERGRTQHVRTQEFALLYAALGDAPNALTYLEKAWEEHSGWLLPFMRVYPPLDALRTEPRFLALQKRMRFPER